MSCIKCSICNGNLHIDSSVTVDGITYRRRKCYNCESAFYFADKQITEEEWRKGRSLYAKKKTIELERRRKSGSGTVHKAR